MRPWPVLLALAGCDVIFPLNEPTGVGDDAPTGPGFAHLPPTITVGDASITVDGLVTIDTTTGLITPALEVPLVEASQVLPGPPIRVLRADEVTITGQLRAVGGRPLAIVSRAITIELGGVLDVSGLRSTGGAGSRGGGTEGSGAPGTTDPSLSGSYISGGGGGGFATAGGDGGRAGALTCNGFAPGGTGGIAYGTADLEVLEGGGAGGSSSEYCGSPPGGGGGAIQLSATETITIRGIVDASGGGGFGGVSCGTVADGGSGGGAGGAIYLEAPIVELAGTLAANGGGGGGGGCQNLLGMAGADGTTGVDPAMGGSAASSPCARPGGAGAAAELAPVAGGSNEQCSDSHGGGGGGSVGRIVVKGVIVGGGITSPDATRLPL